MFQSLWILFKASECPHILQTKPGQNVANSFQQTSMKTNPGKKKLSIIMSLIIQPLNINIKSLEWKYEQTYKSKRFYFSYTI